MHVTDWFTTLPAGHRRPAVPWDRVIDGVNQTGLAYRGCAECPKREGYLYWMGPDLYGVKWRQLQAGTQGTRSTRPTRPLGWPPPGIINLITDPQEREPMTLPYLHIVDSQAL